MHFFNSTKWLLQHYHNCIRKQEFKATCLHREVSVPHFFAKSQDDVLYQEMNIELKLKQLIQQLSTGKQRIPGFTPPPTAESNFCDHKKYWPDFIRNYVSNPQNLIHKINV